MFWEKFHDNLDELQSEERELAARRPTPEAPAEKATRDWDFALGADVAGMSTDAMLSELDDFVAASAEIDKTVMELHATATDNNRLVAVTVNAQGVILNSQVAADAFSRATPAQLATAITEAGRAAAAAAERQVAAAWEPLTEGLDKLSEVLPTEDLSPSATGYLAAARERSTALYPKPVRDSDTH